MKLDVAPMFSAYASLSGFLEEWAYEQGHWAITE